MARFFALGLVSVVAIGSAPAFAQSTQAAEAAGEAAARAMEAATAVAEAAESAGDGFPESEKIPSPLNGSSQRNPRPIDSHWDIIKQADYPISAWQNDEQGRTSYQLDITADGRVSGCMITQSSGSSTLDEATCQIMTERGQFEPGTNEAGEPVPSKFMGDHRWRKRDNDMPDFAVRIDFLMDEQGQPTQCSFEKLRGNFPPSFQRQVDRAERGDLCKMVPGRLGVPYRDENGVPVAKRVSITMDAQVTDPE